MLHLALKAFAPAAGALHAAARGHRAQLPRGPGVPRPAVAAHGLRLHVASVQDYIDGGRLRERPDGTRNPLQTVPLTETRSSREQVRRRVRRRPPRRGEGPRQGARLLAARRVLRSGTRAASAPSCGSSTTAGTRPASTSGSSRCPTGPSWTSGSTSPARSIELPEIYFAHEREVFQRDGMWLTAGEWGGPKDGETRREAAGPLPHRRRHVLHRRRRLRRHHAGRRDRRDRRLPAHRAGRHPRRRQDVRGRDGRPQARGVLLAMTHDRTEQLAETRPRTLLRFATAGSVDDGKSTLVGRLLHDSKSVLTDQLEAVEQRLARAAARRRRTWRCSPTVCAPSASRASPSTSPTATSPRPRAGSSSPTPRAMCSTPATWSPAPPPPS